jgi:flagellar biosynthesis protein FlhF
MPPETFTGPDIPGLLARAHATLGERAIVMAVTRARDGRAWELIAAPEAAGGELPTPHDRTPRSPRASMSPSTESLCGRPGIPALIALVGPTGSGKTTTIAKLANHPGVFGERPVGLLCLDTYRIGAVEQSRIYADLSRLPLEVAHEPRELAGALRRLRDCEIVLVDTAGRGPRAAADAVVTRGMLERLDPIEVHLVLPAGLEPRQARRVLAAHRADRVTHLLPTKLDECPWDRTAFTLAGEHRLPIRWLTDGQEVPGDLRPGAWVFDRAFERSAAARGGVTEAA